LRNNHKKQKRSNKTPEQTFTTGKGFARFVQILFVVHRLKERKNENPNIWLRDNIPESLGS